MLLHERVLVQSTRKMFVELSRINEGHLKREHNATVKALLAHYLCFLDPKQCLLSLFRLKLHRVAFIFYCKKSYAAPPRETCLRTQY